MPRAVKKNGAPSDGSARSKAAQLGQTAGRDPRPVVEPGAPHLLVVEREAERPDEVQLRADGQAGPPGVAGVPVDLRLDEDDVQVGYRGVVSAASW